MKTFNETNGTGNPQPADPNYFSTDNLSSMNEAEVFDNGQDSPENHLSDGAVKGAAWLLGIVGVFAIAILLAWIIGMHDSPLSSRSSARQALALSEQPAAIPQTVITPTQFVAILVPNVTPSSLVATAPSASNRVQAAVPSDSKSVSSADKARIEKEALEVIHGDFGNNPGRKEKLGADYAAVQARVNELMHI